jgi:hypothetical protein
MRQVYKAGKHELDKEAYLCRSDPPLIAPWLIRSVD